MTKSPSKLVAAGAFIIVLERRFKVLVSGVTGLVFLITQGITKGRCLVCVC